MKQSKCSMQKKKESLFKKTEAPLDDLKGMVVSEGTMRSEDLIPKFLNVLKTYGKDKYDAYVKENPEVLDLKGMDDETMGYVFDELFNMLDEIAPEGFYFAAHPDDGACYGFWEVDPSEAKKSEAEKSEKKEDYALFYETRVPGELTGARMFLTDMWNKMGNKKPRITFETVDPDFDSFVSHPTARVYVCGDTRSIASYAKYLLAHYDEIPQDFKGRWVWKDDLAYFARGFKEPWEAKKSEACKGGKADDKKGGKAAESKKSEKVMFNWGILERTLKSLLGTSITDARRRLAIAGWELICEDVSGKVWDFSDGHDTIRVFGNPVNRASLLGDTPYSIALPTINKKTAESKKSEGISDTIKMNIDYNTFMRLLDAAAYLDADDDYKDALWEYYSEFGELDGDACEFFDNLFQYTDWYTAEEVWDNYDNILGEKPEGQDAEEALDAYFEEHGDDLGGSSVYKHGDHYLILQ